MAKWHIVFLAALILPFQAHGVSYRDVEEGGVPPLPDLNVDWMVGVSKFYMLMGSKYTMYRFADSFIGQKTRDLSEDQIKDTLCLATRLTKKGTVTMQGFGKVLDYFMQITSQKQTNKFSLHDTAQTGASQDSSGISYTTMTDNKTYFVAIIYWDMGQRSWIVLSKNSVISESKESEILNHINDAGFDPDHAMKLSYTSCAQDKDEL